MKLYYEIFTIFTICSVYYIKWLTSGSHYSLQVDGRPDVTYIIGGDEHGILIPGGDLKVSKANFICMLVRL